MQVSAIDFLKFAAGIENIFYRNTLLPGQLQQLKLHIIYTDDKTNEKVMSYMGRMIGK